MSWLWASFKLSDVEAGLFLSSQPYFGRNNLATECALPSIKDGVFSSIIYCIDNNRKELELDARTSDAVAIAVRFNAPIFTYLAIMEEAGIILDKDITPSVETKKVGFPEIESEFASLSLSELEEALDKAVSEEDYERASKIRDEVNKRQ